MAAEGLTRELLAEYMEPHDWFAPDIVALVIKGSYTTNSSSLLWLLNCSESTT